MRTRRGALDPRSRGDSTRTPCERQEYEHHTPSDAIHLWLPRRCLMRPGLIVLRSFLCCSILLAAVATSNAWAASQSGISIYTSTVPKTIRLVGSRGGVADDAGTFTVIAHDIANNPVQHSSVVLDFTDAVMSGAIRLSTQQQPGTIVDCAYHYVRQETDANGIATFRVMGAGYNHGGTSDPGTLRVKVFADGYRLNPPII